MIEEIMHIAKSDYDRMVNTAKKIKMYTGDYDESKAVTGFLDSNMFPTVKEMEQHKVKYNMRQYLPFLIYYSDPSIYSNDDPEFQKSQEYINNLINEWVDIVDDADMEPIRSITPGTWKKANLEQRANYFRPLIGYYGWNEFETLVRDLGWQKFMSAYSGYSKKEYEKEKVCSELKEDLAEVWDLVQNEGF